MRRLLFFVAGILVGLAIQVATAQKPNRGIVGLNHVGISVPNLDQAVAYCTKTMGFPEAFRNLDDQGKPTWSMCRSAKIRSWSCSLPAQVRRSGSVTSALS